MTWEIHIAQDGRLVSDLEPRIGSDRCVTVAVLPDEGDPGFDACVDALIGKFHMPEDHATSVVRVVVDALRVAA
jgi:hypothetical protein